MPDRRQADVLLEREPELERIGAAIWRASAGSGGLVVIGGPAGIGKTALMRAARDMAEESGMRVLRARGSDLEQEFAFGVVRQLFEGPLARADPEERASLLDGAAELAGPLFYPGPTPAVAARAAPADRRFTLVHSLYWLTANLSRVDPVALVVDDCHWADAPSLRFLAYVAARRDDLGALLIVTVRDGEPSTAQELLASLRSDVHATLIEPASLSEDAVATLVRSRLGPHAEPEFCAGCARASAGNPFLVRELIAELENEQIAPVAASLSRVENVRIQSVSRGVVARLNRLGTDARNLARSVAVLESASLRQAATLAGIPGTRARRAADRLISAQILASSANLTFVHPLIRHAVYERIPAAALSDGHRRAGLMLASQGARSTRVGAHLLRGEPAGDPAVVTLLRDAAREALGDGSPQTAAHLLRRALEEPPSSALRGVVLGELGEAEGLARDPSAIAHLREALKLATDPELQVRLASALSEVLVWDARAVEAHTMLVDELERLGPDAPLAARAVLETVRAATALIDGRLVEEIDSRLPALHDLAVQAGPAGRGLLVFEGCWKAGREPLDGDWLELLEAGLDGGRLAAEEIYGPQMARHATATLAFTDELERARTLIAAVRADTISRGSINAQLSGLLWGSMLALRKGELPQAEDEARAGLELADRYDVVWAKVWLGAFLAEALLERGALSTADEVLARAPIDRARRTAAGIRAQFVLGRLRIEQSRMTEASALLQALGDRILMANPNYIPWRSALAVATDDLERARALAEEEVRLARWFRQPRGIGGALRVCGLLAGGADGIAVLGEAVAALRSSPSRLELARALYDLGAAQRRAGQRSAARDPLREALGLAQECGADLLTTRIRQELAATGIRLRRDSLSGPAALTPSERRVAELAASGLTNREIAQALFVTVKTVGSHLGHIYDKLDLQGAEARDHLRAMLAETGAGEAENEHTPPSPERAASPQARLRARSHTLDGAPRG